MANFRFAYTYDKPAWISICNHNVIGAKLSHAELGHELDAMCNCEKDTRHAYVDKSHGHVITGDISVIEDREIRQILAKGSKYRLPKEIDTDKARSAVVTGITYIFKTMSKKFKIPLDDFKASRERIYRILHNRIEFIHNNKCLQKQRPTLQINRTNLKTLQNEFVIAPADKAANNFIIICKKFYLQTVCNELGITKVNGALVCKGNNVYEASNKSKNATLERHESILKHLNLKTKSEAILPKFYGLPKMHKQPVKFRFIAAAKKSSMKEADVLLHKILASFKKHFFNYCTVASFGHPNKLYWAIDNSEKVLHRIRKNKITADHQITTADFSTLYTSLPQNVILEQLSYLTDLLFRNSRRKYIKIGFKHCTYTDDFISSDRTLDVSQVKELIHLVVNETYIQFAEFTLRQKTGIPMGGSSSPDMACLTLSVLEFKFLKSNKRMQEQLKCTARYIDDILSVTTDDFMKIAGQIYPPELPLNKTNLRRNEANFLDCTITLNDNHNDRVETEFKIYDKRKEFGFKILRFPHIDSNLSRRVIENIHTSQIIRAFRICTNVTEFKRFVIDTQKSIIENGHSPHLLRHNLVQTFIRHPEIGWKFGLHKKTAIIICCLEMSKFSQI